MEEMGRVAVFVDAGYVFAQGMACLYGTPTPRTECQLNITRFMAGLRTVVSTSSEIPKNTTFLRVYWYDGMVGPTKTASQQAIAMTPNITLRLGTVNSHGVQKGVDSLLLVDLLNLVQHNAITDAVIMTGDADMLSGISAAKDAGVRVHLLAMPTHSYGASCSPLLVEESDSLIIFPQRTIAQSLSHVIPTDDATNSCDLVDLEHAEDLLGESVFDRAVDTFIATVESEGLGLKALAGELPDSPGFTNHRRLLLGISRSTFGRDLSADEISALYQRLTERTGLLQSV